MGEFFRYPHIDALHKQTIIFSCEEIVVHEKLHGANFRVMFPAGLASPNQIRFGSRNREVGLGGGFYGDRPIALWLNNPDLLTNIIGLVDKYYPDDDVIIYGEVFGPGIQKGVKYFAEDKIGFRAFDVRVGERFIDYDAFLCFCAAVNLAMVPQVYRGPPSTEKLNALLEVNSDEALRNGVVEKTNIAEGVVIRPTKMFKDHHDQWVLAKHKSLGFAEGGQGKRGPVAPKASNPCLAVAEEYVTRGRLLNAVEKLTSSGIEVRNDMGDMQKLPGVVHGDILLDLDKDEYGHLDEKGLKSAITRQCAIVYKGILNERLQAAE